MNDTCYLPKAPCRLESTGLLCCTSCYLRHSNRRMPPWICWWKLGIDLQDDEKDETTDG